ncbi:MAG: MarR family winged helix-turn-helix transcriptional regulator [Desulfobacterota bacterium]|nr:MarR family winged helix-turn-helix transcriptional regulator [Thermodesulfobacteriota bacterium]
MNLAAIRNIHDGAEFFAPTKKLRRLSILMVIEHNPNVSQHAIGRLTSLSSAMVNQYIRDLQQERLISVEGDNNRTQTYHLTTAGRKELKSLRALYAAELTALCEGACGVVKEENCGTGD